MRPKLADAGFKRTTGRVFTFENADGNRAYVNIRSWPLGSFDTSFFVDLFIEPAIWRDWTFSRYPNRTDRIGGVWTRRLDSPHVGGWWGINLDDDGECARLTGALEEALPDLVELTDSRTFASRAHEGVYRPFTIGHPEMPLAMLGPSIELDQRLAELESSTTPPEFDLAGYLAFIRNWIDSHFPGRGSDT